LYKPLIVSARAFDLSISPPYDVIDFATDIALEAAYGFQFRVALAEALAEVGFGSRIHSQSADSDDMQRTVGGTIPTTVKAMPGHFPRGGRYGTDPAQGREAGL